MEAEKIICCDSGGNRGWEAAALMNGGMNQWMNNPFAYMMMMALFGMWGGNGWGMGRGAGLGLQDAEIQAKLNAISAQMQDNQNTNLLNDAVKGNTVALGQLSQNLNCDFNALQQAVCGIQAAIQQVGGQIGFSSERVINAVNMGDASVIQALQNCCCQTQQAITKMGYDNQLATCQQTNQFMQRLDILGNAMQQGFSSVAYETQRQTCDLVTAGEKNTQRIIDTLNQHWNAELQQKYDRVSLELSQERQTNYLISQLKSTTTTTATA